MLLFAAFGAPPFLSGICKSVCFLAIFSEADACEGVPAPIGSADRPYSASRTMIASQYYSKSLRRGTVPLCSATHRLHPAIFRLLRPLPPPSRQCSALRPRSSRQFPSLFVLLYVSFAIRPHRVVDAFNSARSLSPSCAGSSAPSLRRIRLHRSLAYATIGSRQSSALQRLAERVLCIG